MKCMTFEEFEEVVAPMVCSYTGLPLSWDGGDLAPSLDRIDNSGSHTRDNVVLSCKRVNLMRGNLTVDEFRNYCRLIVGREGTP